MGKRTLSNLPGPENVTNTFAKERGIPHPWKAVSNVKQKSVTLKNYQSARLAIPNLALINHQKRFSFR